jgi:hypothetical protein
MNRRGAETTERREKRDNKSNEFIPKPKYTANYPDGNL